MRIKEETALPIRNLKYSTSLQGIYTLKNPGLLSTQKETNPTACLNYYFLFWTHKWHKQPVPLCPNTGLKI